jgi:hypothetical protein
MEGDMGIRIGHRLSGKGETLRGRRIHPLRLSRWIAESLLVVLGLDLASDFLARAAEPDPTLTVRVINYTEATPATMAKAQYQAGGILGEAGLHAIWLDCPLGQAAGVLRDPCQRPLKPTEIVLRVLSDHLRNGIRDDAFGFAVLPVLASVYYEHAMGLARREGAEFEVSTILGCVMAHEIGHLLLGSNSHSDTGIMKGQWGRKQVSQILKGCLRFTPQQSKLIQAEGQMRMRLELAQLRVLNSSIGIAAVSLRQTLL